MNHLKIVSAMVLTTSVLAGSAASASRLAVRVPVNAMFGKTHTVSFRIRNDSGQPMKIKAGAQEMTLEPGKATPVKLNVGEQIVILEETAQRPSGTVLTTVSASLSDATLSFK